MKKNFPEYKALDLPEIADGILDFWKREKIFEKSLSAGEGKGSFVFFEGPPSANGLPGIHHVMARAIKDIFCRYKTQKGYRVNRKAGWDTHGLPIELSVEKELGITKEDIGKKISVAQYNAACKKAVMRYTGVWKDLTEKMGYWVDMDDPYVTYEPKYMESVWWLLRQFYDKGLLYKGYTVQPYSPKAGTGLSSHELNQPGCYRDVTDTTVVAQFKAEGDTLPEALQGRGDIHLMAWTTTPWTLPSNTALAVGSKIDYVLIRTFNQYTFEPIHVVVAESLVGNLFSAKYFAAESDADFDRHKAGNKKIPYTVAARCKGEDLEGVRYEQLLPYAQPYENPSAAEGLSKARPENAFRVITGDFVTTEDGTGIVHIAPTFGADDAKVAKEADPPVPAMLVKDENGNLVPLVDLQGKFRPELDDIGGKYVKNEYYEDGRAPEKSVDVEIAIRLKEENKAFKVEKYTHSYPHCWRTDKPVLYYPMDSWFIRVTAFKDRMVALNKTINWKPAATGQGRFGNWLESANDWNLSRSRFWGTPLPIWRTEDGKEEKMIGSVAELKAEMQKAVQAGLMKENFFAGFDLQDLSDENYARTDLHKNVVDEIVLVSGSGQPMKREPDLIDVWFDSGSMPYAQWHYPKEPLADESVMQADFIAEGVDQTRGWFYTLHAIATGVFDRVAYKNVVSNGLVLDKKGQKMSKRLGNAVDPFETLEKYGPDATRWYMIGNANPWDNLKFDLKGLAEVQRKFFGTLYNTYGFFSLYANIDGFDPEASDVVASGNRPEIDRWIRSELHTLIREVDGHYNDYEPTRAIRAISYFVQENLSNWYVRLSRRRFWKSEEGADKMSAYQTLYACLLNVAKLMAPVAPFYADRLYKDLTNGQAGYRESVHLDDYPAFDESYIDKGLESRMHRAQTITSLVLSLRRSQNIRVRQPLQKIMVPVVNGKQKREIEAVSALIKSEVNVKEIELIDEDSGILKKEIRPNFKVLGPRFGKDVKAVAAAINAFDSRQVSEIERAGKIEVKIDKNIVTLQNSEVEIRPQPLEGWLMAQNGPVTVALDITITDKLRNEGIARELVNRIQNLRKDSGFEVTDKIEIELQDHPAIQAAIEENADYVKAETLAKNLYLKEQLKTGLDVTFDDIVSKLVIKKFEK